MADTAPLVGLGILMILSMAIGIAANRASERGGGFLSGYFLGNRGLGSWSMALTATVMSGGTFMGFPSLVYSYGWVLALWIASYMMVPLCTFAVLGKRMGQLSRHTGAITLPDLLRERFKSPMVGIVASLLMMFILVVGLVGQFKSGAIILQKVLPELSGLPTGDFFGRSPQFMFGLVIFTVVVLSYSLYGGFLAAVWTDLFQSILMAVGVVILLPLAFQRSGGLEAATMAGVQEVGPGFALAPGAGRDFLTPGLAFSFFAMWSIAGMGQPATLVRLMAFRDTPTLRHAIFLLGVYNSLIYLPIIFIFICARAILPGLKEPDEVMPTMALTVASPWMAGLILAAPFGAVMATVSGYLVQISSGLVQDVYHRFMNTRATEGQLRGLSYACMLVVALLAAGLAVFSPKFLQALIVFAGGMGACTYLVPAVMAAFWKRATARGALLSMIGGAATVILLYAAGMGRPDPGIGEKSNMFPIYFLGVAPFVWGLVVSVICGVAGSLSEPAPQGSELDELFPDTA
jgi:SSS family solute:Na+ symporter/sodium/pantothenate symporter